MTRRPLSSILASLLLVLQLVMAPFMPVAAAAAGGGCVSMAQPAGSTMAMNGAECGHLKSGAGDCQGGSHHCQSHVVCRCTCAHTPALASIRTLVLDPTPPDAVEVVLATPAFAPPLFELLRPPK